MLFPNTREISSFFVSEKTMSEKRNCKRWTLEAVHCDVGKGEWLWHDEKKLLVMVVPLFINLYGICVPQLKMEAKV